MSRIVDSISLLKIGLTLFVQSQQGNTRAMYEICSKLTINTTEQHHWKSIWCLDCYFLTIFTHCSGVSDFESEDVNAGWLHNYAKTFMVVYSLSH